MSALVSFPPPKVVLLDSYGGIFECFYPGKGCERTLVMAGTFTSDDIYRTIEKIKKDFVEQFVLSGKKRNWYYEKQTCHGQ